VVIDCSVCESTLDGEDMLCVAARDKQHMGEGELECFKLLLHKVLSTANLNSKLHLIHDISLSYMTHVHVKVFLEG
jgi:hypothetical protein